MKVVAIFCLAVAAVSACGKERWVVKVGDDSDAGKVSLLPKPITIEDMLALDKPHKLPLEGRVGPPEMQVWTIKANLTLFKTEADQDYHLVLTSETSGVTMIAEIPHPDCVGDDSPFKKGVKSARAAFETYYNLKPTRSPLLEAQAAKKMTLRSNASHVMAMQRRALLHNGVDHGDDDDDDEEEEEEEVDTEEEMSNIRVARKALRSGGHTTLRSGKHIVNDAVVVTGCGFFDFIHGQTGVAANGIELHPIVKISWP